MSNPASPINKKYLKLAMAKPPGTNEKDKPNWDASVLTLKYIFNPATGVNTNKMRIGVRAKAGLKDVGGLMRSVVGSISLGGHHVRIASSFVRPP